MLLNLKKLKKKLYVDLIDFVFIAYPIDFLYIGLLHKSVDFQPQAKLHGESLSNLLSSSTQNMDGVRS